MLWRELSGVGVSGVGREGHNWLRFWHWDPRESLGPEEESTRPPSSSQSPLGPTHGNMDQEDFTGTTAPSPNPASSPAARNH